MIKRSIQIGCQQMDSDKFYNQCKESDLWVLIQYERPQNVYNYDIIHSSEVIQKDKMHTGKIIDIRYGNSVLKAVIFIISDDKSFLEAEMRNLARPTSLNLTKSVEKLEERSPKPVETYKRRRKMTKSPIEYKPNPSISRLPSPAWSNNTNESTNSNVDKHITVVIPPMTFDQGTQTDIKLSTLEDGPIQSKNISRLVQQLECMIMENQQLRNDNQQIKQTLNDLTNHTYNIKTTMKEIQKKLENNDPHIINSQMKANNEPIVLFTKSSNQIVNLNTAQIDNNLAIETFDVHNENSNISYSNCSRLSMISNGSVFNSTPLNRQSSATGEVIRAQSSNDLKHNWNEFEIEEEIPAEVTIGPNGTRVPRVTVDSIKWSSHSHATRKILSVLFSREELATHLLTGKPSPAFMDSAKPTKNQLNALIIADIVQFVSQKCGVTDTAVRSAITTKCADENKMYRQRMEKKRKILHSMENGNKENDSDMKVAPENLTM